jgi:amidase
VRACLARIEAREPAVAAWEHLDPDAAIRQAAALDRASSRGPLHGVPVAVKDVFDTVDMPTGYGSPIYAGHRPASDAACVALLRAAGAVVLGRRSRPSSPCSIPARRRTRTTRRTRPAAPPAARPLLSRT